MDHATHLQLVVGHLGLPRFHLGLPRRRASWSSLRPAAYHPIGPGAGVHRPVDYVGMLRPLRAHPRSRRRRRCRGVRGGAGAERDAFRLRRATLAAATGVGTVSTATGTTAAATTTAAAAAAAAHKCHVPPQRASPRLW